MSGPHADPRDLAQGTQRSLSRPIASHHIAGKVRRLGAQLLQECRDSGTPTERWPQGWHFNEAAAIAKHLRPGDAGIAKTAYLMLVRVVAAEVDDLGCTYQHAPCLLLALAEFLEQEGYAYGEGKFRDTHAAWESRQQLAGRTA